MLKSTRDTLYVGASFIHTRSTAHCTCLLCPYKKYGTLYVLPLSIQEVRHTVRATSVHTKSTAHCTCYLCPYKKYGTLYVLLYLCPYKMYGTLYVLPLSIQKVWHTVRAIVPLPIQDVRHNVRASFVHKRSTHTKHPSFSYIYVSMYHIECFYICLLLIVCFV